MTNIKNRPDYKPYREVTDPEREELFAYLVNKSRLSGLDICRTVSTLSITVFPNYFSKQTSYDDRLMTVKWPDGKFHHFGIAPI